MAAASAAAPASSRPGSPVESDLLRMGGPASKDAERNKTRSRDCSPPALSSLRGTSAPASDTASGGEASSIRMGECCVNLATFLDGELAAAGVSLLRAAARSPNLSEDTTVAKASFPALEGIPVENQREAAARDRSACSRSAKSTGGVTRSSPSTSDAARGSSGAPIGRLVQPPPSGCAAKRKGGADRCDGLFRAVRAKADVEPGAAMASGDADTTSEDERAASEQVSDATAKPATPDPGTATEAETAEAIKGVLEGLALDGSAGDDHVDIPDGVLAVPLLRHQRRALSWMQRREAPGSSPSGGLLADDQGLGKTFSTIALIAANPPPPRWVRAQRKAPDARPSGGTLVVCPTSVLRQWQRELASKLTPAAGLRVLVHHGVGRTKSASDLTEYDVVLTTFAVVGIEVATPGRAGDGGGGDGSTAVAAAAEAAADMGVNRAIDLTGRAPAGVGAPVGVGAPAAGGGAIGGVDWFRVVLDEAQSVKNARSQVAVAVSAVSAQRRWCLSGTPLQNNVDDLFSYFRFLRYEPYGDPGAFRTMVKDPIRADPAVGFRRLQVILKAVMLRRTKQSQIDGEPIVRLPPRTVVHCQRQFMPDELRGYARLQAEYLSKMEEFAAAGTVSSNYVNLLHMLLRLRQACNHPSLVGGARLGGGEGVGGAGRGGVVAGISGAGERVSAASVGAARRLPAALRGMMRAAAESGRCVCGICGDPPQDPAIASCCTRTFCRDCISPHVTFAGTKAGGGGAAADFAVEDFLCPSCGVALTHAHIHAASALVAADDNSGCTVGGRGQRGKTMNAGASGRGGAVADGGWTRGGGVSGGAGGEIDAVPELRTLLGGTKVQGIMDYLTALKSKHQAAIAAAKAKGKFRGAATAAAAAVAKGTQLRCGIRSSDAALAAALPPLGPVYAPGARPVQQRGTAPPGEKAIVFSQWTAMLDLLEPCLKSAGIHFRRLDGTMSLAARERALSEFEEKPDVTVILMSLKAAGLGVNLTCANHVILSDVWWNPTVEEQAIDRAHRIGQTREVHVVRFTVRGTVEDRILALQDRKRAMVSAAFGEDNDGCVQRTQLTLEDLVFLFGSAAGSAAGSGGVEVAGGGKGGGGNGGGGGGDGGGSTAAAAAGCAVGGVSRGAVGGVSAKESEATPVVVRLE